MAKKHVVMARTPGVVEKGITTSKGKLDFKGKSMMYVDDDLADEIDQTQGLKGNQDVWVHEDPRLNWKTKYKANGIHSYFFGMTTAYSKAWDAFEKRRKKRQGADADASGVI